MARTPKPRMTRKAAAAAAAEERKMRSNAAAARQAAVDALAKPNPPEFEVRKGAQVPLAVANAQQRVAAEHMRDEIRDASVAAAKAVQKTLRSAGGSSRAARRMNKVAAGLAHQ